jgi:hypothetical protein
MVLDDFFCTIDNLFYTRCTVGVRRGHSCSYDMRTFNGMCRKYPRDKKDLLPRIQSNVAPTECMRMLKIDRQPFRFKTAT